MNDGKNSTPISQDIMNICELFFSSFPHATWLYKQNKIKFHLNYINSTATGFIPQIGRCKQEPVKFLKSFEQRANDLICGIHSLRPVESAFQTLEKTNERKFNKNKCSLDKLVSFYLLKKILQIFLFRSSFLKVRQ